MLVPVILSGGNGARLWPISREACPKPFIRFNDSHSLLQKTYQRALHIPNIEKIVTVTNSKYYYQSKRELNKLSVSEKKQFSFLLEPIARDTAPAILLSAFYVQKLVNNDAILLILPADHAIHHQAKFNHCIKKAVALAKRGFIVTFGITPNKAETGYGYIECANFSHNKPSYQVKSFHEKPSRKKASLFLERGNYFWNAGIFCFSSNTLIENMKKFNPTLYSKALDCWKKTKKNVDLENVSDRLILDKESFYQLEKNSIDYALMEKIDNIAVIPANFGWSDIGSWDAFNNLLPPPDMKGNRIIGNAILQKSEATTIYNQNNTKKRIIAALGLKNTIIIDTPDALLVTDKSHTQHVKEVLEELKQRNHEAYQYHQTVYRPWGYYTVLEHEKNYKIKKIVVNPGCRLSLQKHKYRSELWIVIEGTATVQNDEAHLTLKEQESTYIPAGHIHCLANLTLKNLVLIELQLGTYFGEDDITRFTENTEVSAYEEEVSKL